MSLSGELVEAATYIRSRSQLQPQLGPPQGAQLGHQLRPQLSPKIGLVLGSGLGAFAESLEDPTVIPYAEIPHFPRSTAISHKGELVIGTRAQVPVAVMNGRVHLYEGYSLQKVVFPIRVLAGLGVETLIMTNAAGGVNLDYRPGDLMLITDHINLMGGNPLVGPNEESLGERFFDMTDAYDPKLRAVAQEACAAAGVVVHCGVYIAFTGPSYETPAEIRMSRTLGADAVGMSTVPETIAARHRGLRVLGISCITNPAAGVVNKPLHYREVLEVGERSRAALLDVLSRILVALARSRW